MTVFIATRDQRFDVTDAARFGKLVYVAEGRTSPTMDQSLKNCLAILEEHAYMPNADHIALTGPMIHVALLVLAASRVAHGERMRVLVFNSKAGAYREALL